MRLPPRINLRLAHPVDAYNFGRYSALVRGQIWVTQDALERDEKIMAQASLKLARAWAKEARRIYAGIAAEQAQREGSEG